MCRKQQQHLKKTSESPPQLDYSAFDDEITGSQELLLSSDTDDQSTSSEFWSTHTEFQDTADLSKYHWGTDT